MGESILFGNGPWGFAVFPYSPTRALELGMQSIRSLTHPLTTPTQPAYSGPSRQKKNDPLARIITFSCLRSKWVAKSFRAYWRLWSKRVQIGWFLGH